MEPCDDAMNTRSLKVIGKVWVLVLTILFGVTALAAMMDAPTVFTASDMVLASMIVGAYFISDGRLRKLEESQARMEADLGFLTDRKTKAS